jgi:uncharacterized protein (TIGR03435 family)
VFALTQARDGVLGPGLKPAELDCTNRSDPAAQVNARANGVPWCAFQYTDGFLRGRGVTLDQIAGELTADRVVINRTGLPGRFDVDLQWTPDRTQPAVDDAPPALTTALREQLGLRLEPTTVPMEHLVIDAIERPQEN